MYSSVRQVVPVTGNAKPGDFRFWRLQYGQGMDPSAWTPITGERYDRVDNNVLAFWDVSQLDGLYSLQLSVVGGSGNVQQAAVPVTVDNISPTIKMVNPWPDKEYIYEIDEWVNIQVDAQDNVSMNRVEFFLNDKPIGFSTVAPYSLKWTMRMSDTLPAISPEAIHAPILPSDDITPTLVMTNPDGTVIMQLEDNSVFTATFPSGMSIISTTKAYTETHLIHAVAYDDAGNLSKTDQVRIRIVHKPEKEEAPTPTAALLPGDRHLWKRETEFRIPYMF